MLPNFELLLRGLRSAERNLYTRLDNSAGKERLNALWRERTGFRRAGAEFAEKSSSPAEFCRELVGALTCFSLPPRSK